MLHRDWCWLLSCALTVVWPWDFCRRLRRFQMPLVSIVWCFQIVHIMDDVNTPIYWDQRHFGGYKSDPQAIASWRLGFTSIHDADDGFGCFVPVNCWLNRHLIDWFMCTLYECVWFLRRGLRFDRHHLAYLNKTQQYTNTPDERSNIDAHNASLIENRNKVYSYF